MRRSIPFAVLAVLAISSVAAVSGEVRFEGAGATFPEPLYERWVAEFQKLHPDVKIDYQGIGSGGGLKAITEGSVQFAGSDPPPTKDDIVKVGGPENLVVFPTCAGAVVPAYNVPGVTRDLSFSGELLADIYLGKVTKWNDPRIVALNPGAGLPNLAIIPVWRTDGSGTNAVFTAYLADCSDEFRQKVGSGKQVKWPVGQGGKGGVGPGQVIQQTEGTIGYLELNYARKNRIPFGAVENEGGKFLKATPKSVAAAGDAAAGDMTGPILAGRIGRQPGADVYPIAAFTYVLLRKDMSNCKSREQAQAVLDFLWWAVHEGQKDAAEMDYAPLGKAVQGKASKLLQGVTYKGERLQTRAEHDRTPK
ncbi:MAG TPA: phosphate ABC transporter substrate-binding protein PstS [Tepidisphaeraceae bacterium]|jgi:phosphate transport system substrate-binding protein